MRDIVKFTYQASLDGAHELILQNGEGTESIGHCWKLENARFIVDYLNRCVSLHSENTELRKDKERIDWLADLDNEYGNVELPRDIVERNLHSLRAAIDEAMEMQANNSTV